MAPRCRCTAFDSSAASGFPPSQSGRRGQRRRKLQVALAELDPLAFPPQPRWDGALLKQTPGTGGERGPVMRRSRTSASAVYWVEAAVVPALPSRRPRSATSPRASNRWTRRTWLRGAGREHDGACRKSVGRPGRRRAPRKIHSRRTVARVGRHAARRPRRLDGVDRRRRSARSRRFGSGVDESAGAMVRLPHPALSRQAASRCWSGSSPSFSGIGPLKSFQTSSMKSVANSSSRLGRALRSASANADAVG